MRGFFIVYVCKLEETKNTLRVFIYMEFSIKKIISFQNYIVVLFNIDGKNVPDQGIKNLICFDNSGKLKWVADLPNEQLEFGFYSHIELEKDKLLAWCGSFYCEIDSNTGRILKEQFVR